MSFTYQGKQVRRSTGTSDRKLAEAILSKIRVNIVEGRYFETLQERERTFREMMDRYMKEYAPKKAPESHVRDQSCLKHLLPLFGDKTLAEVTPKLVSDYKVKRREEGAKAATINKELGTMRHAFNVAIKSWEWCRDNPVQKVGMEPVHNQIDRWLTTEEEGRLLAASPVWLREIIVFALNTGMRRGEILALLWGDVDFERSVLVVMKSKNKERRTIPINNRIFELLFAKQAGHSKDKPVFTTSCGTAIIARNLVRAFYTAMEKAKILNFRFHDLRHSFATRLVQAGMDLYKVQRLLGHKSPAMTQRYAHHSPESLRDAVEVLDRISAKEQTISKKLAQN